VLQLALETAGLKTRKSDPVRMPLPEAALKSARAADGALPVRANKLAMEPPTMRLIKHRRSI
jgi:hypothetical protein